MIVDSAGLQISLFGRPLEHDPGGRVRLKLAAGVEGKAIFGGSASEYRYQLSRIWGYGSVVAFILMNPSTADPMIDDPTVAKCGRFARKWGFQGLLIGNTFAYRATDQMRLLEVQDPIGPENDEHIMSIARSADLVVFGYGKPRHKALRARGPQVARNLLAAGITPHVLRLSADRTPHHPLYLPEDEQSEPQPWEPA